MVIQRKRVERNTSNVKLVEEEAAAHHVNKDRVWEAVRKHPEYKPRSYPGK
jgi:hypothetical protein